MTDKIRLTNVLVSFPALFAPKVVNGPGGPSAPKFGGCFLMERDDPQIEALRKLFKKVAIDKWGSAGETTFKALTVGNKLCLHDGDAKAEWDGFEGRMYVSANSPTRPMVVDSDRITPLTLQDGRPYAGCYVHASLDIWAQDHHSFGKRINAKLLAVMFAKDGVPFAGGATADENEFDGVDGDDPLA